MQEKGVDKAINGRSGPDRHAQCENDGKGQFGLPANLSEAEPKIPEDGLHCAGD